MLKTNLRLLGAASLAAMLVSGSAQAQQSAASADQVDKLESQVKALEREVQALKKERSTKTNAAEGSGEGAYAAATPAPIAKAPAPGGAVVKMSAGNRPSICTVDGLNCISLTSRLHFDAGGYSYHPNTAATSPQNLDNGFNARRARIGVLGTFAGDWNYALVYDFGGSSDGLPPVSGAPTSGIENAYLSYVGFKPLAIEGGYMDVLYTLDESTSSNDIMFMERASAGVIAANIAAGDFRSAFGVRGNDDRLFGGVYVTGPTSGTTHIFTPGSTTTGSPGSLGSPGFSEQIGGVARVTYQLLQDTNYSLHIGADAELLINPVGTKTLTLSDRPELRIDPTSILSTGSIANVADAQVYSGEAAAGLGPLYFQGEYFWFRVDRNLGLPSTNFQGWYAEGSWTITGESRKYNPAAGAYLGIVPDHPFNLVTGDMGAWEVAFRYSHVDLNDLFIVGVPVAATNGIAGGVQNIYTVGLNWYVNRNVRIMANYLHGTIDKFAGAAIAGPPAFPVGTDIGAKFDALAMRTQIAF